MDWNWRKKRHGYWSLEGLPDKTGRKEGKGNRRLLTFLNLRFTVEWMEGSNFFRCKVKTSKKKFRGKIKEIKEWIKKNRGMPLEWLFEKINAKLRGHYQYYGVTDNKRELKNFLNQTKSLLFKWLNRRSEKRSYTWSTFNNGLLRTFPLIESKIKVSLLYR